MTLLINTYTCPWAKIASRHPSTSFAIVNACTLCTTNAYAGQMGSWTIAASCGALPMRGMTSTQSTFGSRTRCATDPSWQNLAQIRSSLAG